MSSAAWSISRPCATVKRSTSAGFSTKPRSASGITPKQALPAASRYDEPGPRLRHSSRRRHGLLLAAREPGRRVGVDLVQRLAFKQGADQCVEVRAVRAQQLGDVL